MRVEAVTWEGRKMGDVVDGIIFTVQRNETEHLFKGGETTAEAARAKNLAAWCVRHRLLQSLEGDGIQIVVIEDREHGTFYWAGLARLLRDGFRTAFSTGEQLCLPLGQWHKAESLEQVLHATLSAISGMQRASA